ncbi:MAG TPA: iron-containing alcohol dehydrogenase [Anaerolineales bacterium]|nr:iron-containing alcohol dehydrogenase [Anaerolineales bacterium]
MRFEFATANRIIFGPGSSAGVPELAVPLGKRPLVVAGSTERAATLIAGLEEKNLAPVLFLIDHEPDLAGIELATRSARESGCDFVIGIGGGAALDTGKTVAALLTNPGDLLDYLEVVGAGRALENPSLPYIAIPTTAGTGSEVTRNAVVTVPEKRVKVSLRSPFLLPRLAVVNPELTYSLPPTVTASTGMDALTQLIEPFTSNAANPLSDAICREGIPRAARSLQKACEDGKDVSAREDMSLASLYGGLALTNAKLGAVHGLAGPIGGLTSAPHGALCARLLPLVVEANLRAIRSRQPDSPALARYTEVAVLLTGRPRAKAEETVVWLKELCARLGIQPLSAFGLNAGDYPALVDQSQNASSMRGNSIRLTDEEILGILENAN